MEKKEQTLKDEKRFIFITKEIDAEMHENVAKDLLTFEHSSKLPIYVHINSPGGSVYEMLGIIDLFTSSSCPIITTCTGKAMSAAVPILACGKRGYRRIGKNSTVMLHEVSSFSWGKMYELEVDHNEAKRVQELYLSLLAKFTKTPIQKFKKLFDTHKDLYLTANEAKKLGIVDEIF